MQLKEPYNSLKDWKQRHTQGAALYDNSQEWGAQRSITTLTELKRLHVVTKNKCTQRGAQILC